MPPAENAIHHFGLLHALGDAVETEVGVPTAGGESLSFPRWNIQGEGNTIYYVPIDGDRRARKTVTVFEL